MNIIILGDRFQKRMKSKGCVGLYKNNNTYLIIKQYKTLKKIFPDANIIYVYGFEHKKFLSSINQYDELLNNIQFVFNPNYELYNYGSSLQLVKEYLLEDTIILLGDLVLDYKIISRLKNDNKYSKVVITNKKNKLGCIVQNSKVENIFYDLDNFIEEIYYITKKDISSLKEILSSESVAIKNMFIFELLNKMIDSNVAIKALICSYQTINKNKTKNVI